MWSCFDPWRTAAASLDALAVGGGTHAVLAARQQSRLAALLQAAARGSPLYRERLDQGRRTSLCDVPPVDKSELMQRFDEWVTDPRLRLAELRAFAADASRIGDAFEGDFVVWESSGSSGEPAMFVQDARAMAVYDALEACRGASRWLDSWRIDDRIAFVGATGGHFASSVSVERLRRLNPGIAQRVRSFSFLQRTDALVEHLNRHAPAIVATYPTAAVLLAEEHAAGRLTIAPREVSTGGETLTPGMRRCIEHRFGCTVANNYGASEFLPLAWQCRSGALHVNSDWVILEPVDEHLRPVPPGMAGSTTLLTNLANHVQPLIRYDLGDRVVVHPQRCACGSPLPTIDVQGRCDDMVVLRNGRGRGVRLLPLALTTVLEDDGGVFDFQLVQLDAGALQLTVGADAGSTERARTALAAYLKRQGLPHVRIEVHAGTHCVQGRSGKLQRVVAREAETLAA